MDGYVAGVLWKLLGNLSDWPLISLRNISCNIRKARWILVSRESLLSLQNSTSKTALKICIHEEIQRNAEWCSSVQLLSLWNVVLREELWCKLLQLTRRLILRSRLLHIWWCIQTLILGQTLDWLLSDDSYLRLEVWLTLKNLVGYRGCVLGWILLILKRIRVGKYHTMIGRLMMLLLVR